VIPEKENIYEPATQHFASLQILKLEGDPKRDFKNG